MTGSGQAERATEYGGERQSWSLVHEGYTGLVLGLIGETLALGLAAIGTFGYLVKHDDSPAIFACGVIGVPASVLGAVMLLVFEGHSHDHLVQTQ